MFHCANVEDVPSTPDDDDTGGKPFEPDNPPTDVFTAEKINNLNLSNNISTVDISWVEPKNLNYKFLRISYTTNGGKPIIEDIPKGTLSKQFTNLANGDYIFTFRSIYTKNRESKVITQEFTIAVSPPDKHVVYLGKPVIISFDINGKVKRQVSYQSDGVTKSVENLYREDETLSKTIIYQSDGDKKLNEVFYGEAGIIEILNIVRYQEDGIIKKEEIFYNKDGTQRQVIFYQSDGKTKLKEYLYSGNDIKNQEIHYQSDGKTIWYESFHEEDGTLIRTIFYQPEENTKR